MSPGLEAGFVARACPLCGSRDESRVFAPAAIDESRLDAFSFSARKTPEGLHCRLIECAADDLLYASPAPTDAFLAAAYREAAFSSGEEARCAGRTYARFLPRLAARLPDRSGVLDIGAGDGSFLEEALAQGFAEVAGVEPSEAPIAAARPEIRPRIRRGFFSAEDFTASSYSLVTSFQALEHVRDPLALCRGAHRLLKPGGALFLVGHDRRAFSARLLGLKSPIFDIEHLQLFSSRSLRGLLERGGFTGISVFSIANRYPLRYWLKLLPLPSALRRVASALARSRVGGLPIALPAGNIAAIGFKAA